MEKAGDLQFADVCEVYKGRFLGTHSYHLRRLHHKLSLLSSHHVWVLLPHDVEDSVEQLNGGIAKSHHYKYSHNSIVVVPQCTHNRTWHSYQLRRELVCLCRCVRLRYLSYLVIRVVSLCTSPGWSRGGAKWDSIIVFPLVILKCCQHSVQHIITHVN